MRHGSKPGPAPYLDEAEDDELVQFLMKSADNGMCKNKEYCGETIKRKEEVWKISMVKGGTESILCSAIQGYPCVQVMHSPE